MPTFKIHHFLKSHYFYKSGLWKMPKFSGKNFLTLHFLKQNPVKVKTFFKNQIFKLTSFIKEAT